MIYSINCEYIENVTVTAPDSNTTCLHCEEKCDKIAFRNEISSGFYPNLVQEYPEALYKRYSFTKEDLNSYAQYVFILSKEIELNLSIQLFQFGTGPI